MVHPTPYPEVNILLQVLIERVQGILGDQFMGMYLDGSLATGDFDPDSDIDFVVVTQEEVSPELFAALQALHDQVARIDSPLAVQLEGSYISLHALRRHDPALTLHPNIERGEGERLKYADHDAAWNVHRFILRQKGIVLAGPHPASLIDPVTPEDLRQGMQPMLESWLPHFLDHPEAINHRGYQSYIVLSLCRILYTLRTGQVASKPAAAAWAKKNLPEPWIGLIDRAWEGRHGPVSPADPDEVRLTQEFIRYILNHNVSSA